MSGVVHIPASSTPAWAMSAAAARVHVHPVQRITPLWLAHHLCVLHTAAAYRMLCTNYPHSICILSVCHMLMQKPALGVECGHAAWGSFALRNVEAGSVTVHSNHARTLCFAWVAHQHQDGCHYYYEAAASDYTTWRPCMCDQSVMSPVMANTTQFAAFLLGLRLTGVVITPSNCCDRDGNQRCRRVYDGQEEIVYLHDALHRCIGPHVGNSLRLAMHALGYTGRAGMWPRRSNTHTPAE